MRKLFAAIALLFIFGAVTGRTQENSPSKRVTKVVVITPQSGSSAYFGQVVANGIVLSLKSVGPSLEYRVLDDKSNPELAASLVKQADSWGAVSIVGPLDSDVAAAVIVEAERIGIPLITPCATATYLTQIGKRWFFRANTSDRQRADELASWATEIIGRKGMLVVHETRSAEDKVRKRAQLYGESMAEDLLQSLNTERQPATAVGFERGAFGAQTQEAIVKRMREGVVGGVAVLCRSLEAVPVTEFIRSHFPDMPIFLISPGRDQFTQSKVKNGVYAVTDTVIEVTKSAVLDDFRRRYTLEFPGQPSPTQQCATFGYDAAEILLGAIRRARKAETKEDLGALRAAVRDELEATPNDRQGIVSVGGFTKSRELNFRPHRVLLHSGKWADGSEVAPPDETPPWRNFMYFAVLLAFLATLVALLVWQLPKLHRYGDRTVVFVISAIVGLVAAVVTFGALRSYGSISGQSVGVAFEFGGPAALFLGVILLGTRTPKGDTAPFTVTVIIHEGANARGVVPVDGTILLLLSKGARVEPIKGGQAVFHALDVEYKHHSVDYIVTVLGYSGVPDAPQLRLTPDGVLYVRVNKEPGRATAASAREDAPAPGGS